MKFVLKVVCLLCFALLLTGCAEKPASVAEKFATAISKGDFEEAKKYASTNTVQLLDFLVSLGDTVDKKDLDQGFKFVFIREEIDGNTATVYFKDATAQKEESFPLIKEDGKWKVDMPKQ